jgi:hypothetical protein
MTTSHRRPAGSNPWLPHCLALWGTFFPVFRSAATVAPGFPVRRADTEATMHGLIYLVGLIVVVLFILSLLGLR